MVSIAVLVVLASGVSGASILVEFPITTELHEQWCPAIYGNIIVWEDWRNGGWPNLDIYGYDLITSTEFQITTIPATEYWQQRSPAIYGNTVVWQDDRNGNYDIYGYNMLTNQEVRITTDPNNQYTPAIYGNIVVWNDYRNGNGDVYGYHLITKKEFPITKDPSEQWYPEIYKNTVIWQDWRNDVCCLDNADAYGYDLATSTEFQITSYPGREDVPAIYGNIVAWHSGSSSYFYDHVTSTRVQITITSSVFHSPAVYCNIVVWMDYRNGNSDIYAALLDTNFCTRPTSSVYHSVKSMEPLAKTNMLKAKELQSEALDVLSQAQEKGIDTSCCEGLLEEAEELLLTAQEYFKGGNYIAANNYAIESIRAYEEFLECLRGLDC